eukprot:g31236.t1
MAVNTRYSNRWHWHAAWHWDAARDWYTWTPHGITTPLGVGSAGHGTGTGTGTGTPGMGTPGVGTPIGGIGTPVGGGVQTPVGGIATPVGGIATPVGGIATPVGGIATPVGGIATPAPTPVGGADTPGPVTMNLNPEQVETEGILTADIIRQQLKQHEEAAAKAKLAAGQKEVEQKKTVAKPAKKRKDQLSAQRKRGNDADSQWGSRLKSRRSFYNLEREVISKDNFNEEDKDQRFLATEAIAASDVMFDFRFLLSNLYDIRSGLWFVHSKMSTWEEPYQERKLGLLPRSRESGESVLARHDIAAFCCKGCKDIDDFSPGQDNFSCARLAGGFRLHCIADGHGPGGHWVSDRVELEKICVEGERGRVPELGFTRSLGDLMYKRFGVIAEPEIFKLEKELDSSGHFILASDGVWEFLSSDDIAKIVQSKLAVGMPKEAIVREVAQAGRRLAEGSLAF